MGIQWGTSSTMPVQSQAQLAGVITGESSTPAGQFAVASVMYNRMSIAGPYAGGGSGDITQVVSPGQFNGYNPNASPYANQLAADLWAGNPPSGGTTGNATFFAAPSSSNVSWANPNTSSGQGLFGAGNNKIGGNYFSDKQGPPSSSFQAPQYGGAGGNTSGGVGSGAGISSPGSEATFSGSENTGDNETTYGTPYGSGQLEGDTSYMQPNFGGGSTDFTSGDSNNPAAGQVPTPPQDASGNLIGAQNPDNQTFNFPQNNGVATDFGGQPFDSGITGIPPGSSAGSGMAAGLSPTALTGTAGGVFAGTPLAGLGLGGVAPTGDANTPAIASGTGSGGGTSGGDSSGGVPVDITDPSKIAVDAGSKVQEGAKDLGKSIGETGKAADTTITASTASLTSTGTGWLQYAGNLLFDFIPRAGFGLAAIVLILMGLWLMGKQNEGEKT